LYSVFGRRSVKHLNRFANISRILEESRTGSFATENISTQSRKIRRWSRLFVSQWAGTTMYRLAKNLTGPKGQGAFRR